VIVRPKPGLRDIFLAINGSILPEIAGRVFTLAAISIGAVVLEHIHPGPMRRLSAVPFTLIGLALSIFMSFRNTACYDRWWEARKLWGQLIIAMRSFSRQIATLEQDAQDQLRAGLCGFAHGLAARLRGLDEIAAIRPWRAAEDAPNPTDRLLAWLGEQCVRLMQEGRVNPLHYSVLEIQLTELAHVQAGCERIKATPLPFAYSLLLHRTAYLFCLLLPFALAPALSWWTPLPVVIVSYTFFGLDALSDQLEDPFGEEANDLPLDAMVRTIERELRFAMGERDLPPPLAPRGDVLM
jgi:putative membrane protein